MSLSWTFLCSCIAAPGRAFTTGNGRSRHGANVCYRVRCRRVLVLLSRAPLGNLVCPQYLRFALTVSEVETSHKRSLTHPKLTGPSRQPTMSGAEGSPDVAEGVGNDANDPSQKISSADNCHLGGTSSARPSRACQRRGVRLRSGVSARATTATSAARARYSPGAIAAPVIAMRLEAIIGVIPPKTPTPILKATE